MGLVKAGQGPVLGDLLQQLEESVNAAFKSKLMCRVPTFFLLQKAHLLSSLAQTRVSKSGC